MAAVPSQAIAPSGSWNEGNPSAEGSGRPPSSPLPPLRHRERHRRIPWMLAGAPAATARRQKEGVSPQPGVPEGQAQPPAAPTGPPRLPGRKH